MLRFSGTVLRIDISIVPPLPSTSKHPVPFPMTSVGARGGSLTARLFPFFRLRWGGTGPWSAGLECLGTGTSLTLCSLSATLLYWGCLSVWLRPMLSTHCPTGSFFHSTGLTTSFTFLGDSALSSALHTSCVCRASGSLLAATAAATVLHFQLPVCGGGISPRTTGCVLAFCCLSGHLMTALCSFLLFRRTSSQRTLSIKTNLEETIMQPRVP